MGQGRHTLRSTSDPVYPQTNARCSIYIAERLASEKEYPGQNLHLLATALYVIIRICWN